MNDTSGYDTATLAGGCFWCTEAVERVVYILVGAGAVYEIVMHKMQCRVCSGK